MRRDVAILTAIVVLAFTVRTYPAWDTVLGATVSFLETDAWYHTRLIESQVRNYPWRLSRDPYAAAGGQFVPIAPFFDTLTATAVVLIHGRDADTDSIERIASFVPPVLGVLTIIAVWALGRRVFGAPAGLMAAALLAVLPGHFMDRTTLGFVDHHALEALLAMVTLLTIAVALIPSPRAVASVQQPPAVQPHTVPLGAGTLVGLTLGLYLLSWGSGALLLAIVGAWLVVLSVWTRTREECAHAGALIGVASVVALAMVLLFQDARMHRYDSQVIGLVGLGALAGAVAVLARTGARAPRRVAIAAAGAFVCASAVVWWWLWPSAFAQVLTDVGRLVPDPTRMGVLEARPLFLYSGQWRWMQPWDFFRTGFYAGLVGLVLLGIDLWRHRRPVELLIWVFAAAAFIITFGQNRFGYYLVPACALLAGWLVFRVPGRPARSSEGASRVDATVHWLTVAAVATALFVPNLWPSVLLKQPAGGLAYWQDTMVWLRENTPPPFPEAASGEDYYLARYSRDHLPMPAYTIMNWWDQGYWIIQRARRVPVSNPTQERAPNAARFYVETDESGAVSMLREERARFVLLDWELPFRYESDGRIMGRFQSLVDWAGETHARYYDVYHQRVGDTWKPLWVFHPAYYQSMAFRLAVLGGEATIPAGATTVLSVADRTDSQGRAFREVLGVHTYPTYEAALEAAAGTSPAMTALVGLDPRQSAFPLDRVRSLVQVHEVRTPGQLPSDIPVVRVFQLR
jgi:dolichyl-phosphooligosaccharide-protein glycotransferase